MENENIKYIGIMVNSMAERKSYLRASLAYNQFETVKLFSFTPKNIDWKTHKINGLYFINGKYRVKKFQFPSAVYNRCSTKRKKIIEKLERVIGKDKIFNHITRFNKWDVYNSLSKTMLMKYLPKTFIYDENELIQLLYKYKSLFLKPCYGLKGFGIYKIEYSSIGQYIIYKDFVHPLFIFNDKEAFLRRVRSLVRERKYIIQEEIYLAKGSVGLIDIRTMVQKNRKGEWELAGGFIRMACWDVFITNIAYSILKLEKVFEEIPLLKFKQKKITQDLFTVSIEIANEMEKCYGHLGELAIDLGITSLGEISIIEVNGYPSKSIVKQVNNEKMKEKIYTNPIDYAYYLANQRKDASL